ncbi:hypothetical protein T265_12852, partial [Opisthorchis viverrini]
NQISRVANSPDPSAPTPSTLALSIPVPLAAASLVDRRLRESRVIIWGSFSGKITPARLALSFLSGVPTEPDQQPLHAECLCQEGSRRTLGLLDNLSSPSAIQKTLERAGSIQKAYPMIRRLPEDRPLEAQKLGPSRSRVEAQNGLPLGASSADTKLMARPIVIIASCAPESMPTQPTASPDSSFYSTTTDPSSVKCSDALEEATSHANSAQSSGAINAYLRDRRQKRNHELLNKSAASELDWIRCAETSSEASLQLYSVEGGPAACGQPSPRTLKAIAENVIWIYAPVNLAETNRRTTFGSHNAAARASRKGTCISCLCSWPDSRSLFFRLGRKPEFPSSSSEHVTSWCSPPIPPPPSTCADPAFLEQLTKNITRYGMTTNTLNFFRLCVILEPMQELMSRQKAYSLTPRDCLKTTLFQKWQRMMPQVRLFSWIVYIVNNSIASSYLSHLLEATRQPSKRRKRKGSAAATETNSNSNTGRASKRKQSPAPLPSHHIAQPGDVMIVGEPTLMGGDFGDEDERLITRLENTQYDAAMNANPHMHPNFSSPNETPNLISSPPGSVNLPMNSGPHSLPGVQFRTALSLGGPNSHPGMAMNDPVFSNSLLSTSQHPSGVPVSMFPGQQQQHPISTSARFAPHSNPVMVSQHYVLAQSKSSMSGSNTPSSRDFYQPPLPSSASDLMMHPSGRSSSTSSLVDGGSSLSGFPNCPSPNMPSRQSARFTPPGLPNGLGSVSSTSAQQNFLLPPEMVGCANSLSQMPISCSSLGSTPPTSYTPEAIDSTNMMHSSVNQASAGTAVKAGASPVIFSCMGSGTNGTQGTPEPCSPIVLPSFESLETLAPMMVGPGCDQLPAGVLNEAEDIKSSVAHHVRSNSES